MALPLIPLKKLLRPKVSSSGKCVGGKLSQVEGEMYFSNTAISRSFYRFFHSK